MKNKKVPLSYVIMRDAYIYERCEEMKKIIYIVGSYSILSFACLGVATCVRRIKKCLN